MSSALLFELVRDAAADAPETVAIVGSAYSVTYNQFLESVRATADLLVVEGVSREDRVAVESGDDVDSITRLLAALSLAADIVVLPAGVSDRQARASNLGASVLVQSVRSPGSDPEMAELGPRVRRLCDPPARLSSEPVVVFSTSGTTGAPKSVVHTHWSLAYALHSTIALQSEAVGEAVCLPTADDELRAALASQTSSGRDLGLVLLPGMSVATIAGFSMVLRSLITGATCVYPPGFEAGRYLDLVEINHVTNIGVAPFMAQALLRVQRRRARDVSSLFMVGLGAGPTPSGLLQEMEEAFGCLVSIGYGMTETGGVVCFGRASESSEVRSETIGRPVPGASARLEPPFDEWDSGATGELAISTPSLMLGYLDAEHRLVVPSTVKDGWFRTGDRARIRPSGDIELRGRLSELIVRGGRNVDPVEVEHVLEAANTIKSAFVFGRPSRVAGEEDICAAVVRSPSGSEVTTKDLRRHCIEQLGVGRVPNRIAFVDELPRTADGAISRAMARALVEPMFSLCALRR